tara:strand:- start:2291 stop:3586 length:1296 start_codon:yes stop_codon:yes gene_type:complete
MVTTIGNHVVKKKKKQRTKNKRKIQRGGMLEVLADMFAMGSGAPNSRTAEDAKLVEMIKNGYNEIPLSIGTSEYFVTVLQNDSGMERPLRDHDHILGRGSYGVVKKNTYKGQDYAFKLPKFPDCAANKRTPNDVRNATGIYKDAFEELGILLLLQSRSREESSDSSDSEDTLMRAGLKDLTTIEHSHPNIAQLRIVILQNPSLPVIGLELAVGGALDHQLYVKKWKPDLNQILKFIKEIGGALAHLHTAYSRFVDGGYVGVPILHRDLKSPNVLLTADVADQPETEFSFKLTDFGLAREMKMEEDLHGTMMTGCGSVLWMAPEILLGNTYNEKIDIFSFGMTILEMYTCALPWIGVGVDAAAVPRQVSSGLRPVRQFSRGLQEVSQIENIIKRCWNQSPPQRPTATDCVDDPELRALATSPPRPASRIVKY